MSLIDKVAVNAIYIVSVTRKGQGYIAWVNKTSILITVSLIIGNHNTNTGNI